MTQTSGHKPVSKIERFETLGNDRSTGYQEVGEIHTVTALSLQLPRVVLRDPGTALSRGAMDLCASYPPSFLSCQLGDTHVREGGIAVLVAEPSGASVICAARFTSRGRISFKDCT